MQNYGLNSVINICIAGWKESDNENKCLASDGKFIIISDDFNFYSIKFDIFRIQTVDEL